MDLAIAMAEGPVLLDGGLATQLESRGHDLSTSLWSARLLAEDPDEIASAHGDFFAVGAEVATTASYQVSFEAMAAIGLDAQATRRLLTLSVELARRAGNEYDGRRWVAASVGPYGASLAGGQEYVGDYGLSADALRAWHRPRLETLMAAEPDVLALETIPCLVEVEALLAEVSGSGVPAWLSLTSQGLTTRQHEPLSEAFAMAADVEEVVAVGVNCCSSTGLDAVVTQAERSSGKPGVVYPNSGEGWDGEGRGWSGDPAFTPAEVSRWVDAGARLVGGCCRVTPAHIAQMATILTVR